MKEILAIGYNIPSENDDYAGISERVSLSDADIVVFCPDFDTACYERGYPSTYYSGKPCFDSNSSFQIKEDAQYWRREINAYLENGRTLFIFLKEYYDFYVHTGQKTTSGTGRNQRVTNIVELFNNYKYLPIDIKVYSSSGKKVVVKSDLVKNYYKCFENELNFEAYINSEEINNLLFTSKAGDKILGANLKVLNGHVVILPYLDCDEKHYYDYKKEEWNKEGIAFGKKLINCLIEIDKRLSKKSNKTPKPEWIHQPKFELKESVKTLKLINDNNAAIKSLIQQKNNLKEVLEEQESLQDLLFETGKPLELAVIKGLKLLGYYAENYDDGNLELDQVITSPEGLRFIGECEGKDSKDIDISKFRQLSDVMNEDFSRDEIEEKAFGLLFGNPQRLIAIEERNLDFTAKCKRGAEREKIGLILTSELFKVARYLLENKNEKFKKSCRLAIQKGLGGIIKFPDIPI